MDASCCHSCGTEVDRDTPRCPMCYVALEAATRAPSPLRAATSAVATEGALARVAETAVMEEPPWPVGVRCPACETTVTPITGWCSYCMEPLPADESADHSPEAKIIVGPWPAHTPAVATTVANRAPRFLPGLIDASVFLPGLVLVAITLVAGAVLLGLAMVVTAWQVLWVRRRRGQTFGQSLARLTTSGREGTFRCR